MRVLRHPTQLNSGSHPVCVALGFFDGVHRGHQQVLRHAQNRALAANALTCAVTFDRHPAAVVAPDRAPALIQTLDQRIESLARLNLDAAWIIEFTPEFSRLTATQFVHWLIRSLGSVLSLHVGHRFRFGHQRAGTIHLLRTLEPDLGFATESLDDILLENEPVSSTRVRHAIRQGDLAAAGSLLGRPYALRGPVVPGDRLGRTLSFPTANLDTQGLVLPLNGVYAAWAAHVPQRADPTHVPATTATAQGTPALVNIGLRPTLGTHSPPQRVEAHLLAPTGDLYGKTLELTFIARLRPERKFPSLDDLRSQIQRDIADARPLFTGPPPAPNPPA